MEHEQVIVLIIVNRHELQVLVPVQQRESTDMCVLVRYMHNDLTLFSFSNGNTIYFIMCLIQKTNYHVTLL